MIHRSILRTKELFGNKIHAYLFCGKISLYKVTKRFEKKNISTSVSQESTMEGVNF